LQEFLIKIFYIFLIKKKEFDEYLIQVEEMLSQKAHSIRDLQYQITQLKHLKNPTNEQII